MSQGQEKWSSVRITESKKNSMKIENHIQSVHSNLNLNGLCPNDGQLGLGKEVNCERELSLLMSFSKGMRKSKKSRDDQRARPSLIGHLMTSTCALAINYSELCFSG